VVHGSTFSKNDLAMAAGLATLEVIESEGLMKNAEQKGARLLATFERMIGRHELVKEVRGKGLMIGIEFGAPRSLKLKASWNLLETANSGLFCQLIVIPLLKEHRILSQVAGHGNHTIKLLPPLIITDEDCDWIERSFETVIADDPQLNVRDASIELLGRQPLRVVLDTRLRLTPAARVLHVPGRTVVFTAAEKLAAAGALQQAGAEVIGTGLDTEGHVDLQNVLVELGRRECNDVLVEAGPTLAGRFLQLGLADELIVYIAPIILGAEARAMALLPPLYRIEDVLRYTLHGMERIGADVKLILRP